MSIFHYFFVAHLETNEENQEYSKDNVHQTLRSYGLKEIDVFELRHILHFLVHDTNCE